MDRACSSSRSLGKVRWRVGVMRDGERLQQCSTKSFMYRVPQKRSKVHSTLLEVIHQKLQMDLTKGFRLSLVMDNQSEVTRIMAIVQKCGN